MNNDMVKNKISLRSQLTKKERKIFDSIKSSFPATSDETAYDHAINGGVKFQFIST